MTGPAWTGTVDADAFHATAGSLVLRLMAGQPAGTNPGPLAAFATALTLTGTEHLRALVARFAPAGSDVQVVDQLRDEPAQGTLNLYVQCVTAGGTSVLGMRIALADTLFEDWEAPARGVRAPWKALVREAAGRAVAWTPAGLTARLQELGPEIETVLQGGADRPLEYRARLSAAMVTSPDPQTFEAAKQELLRQFPDMGMRHQAYAGERPDRAEVNRRFQGMPFERGGRSRRNR